MEGEKLRELIAENRGITIPVSYTHLDVYKRQAIPVSEQDAHRKLIQFGTAIK